MSNKPGIKITVRPDDRLERMAEDPSGYIAEARRRARAQLQAEPRKDRARQRSS